jgi:hypothetical protein
MTRFYIFLQQDFWLNKFVTTCATENPGDHSKAKIMIVAVIGPLDGKISNSTEICTYFNTVQKHPLYLYFNFNH